MGTQVRRGSNNGDSGQEKIKWGLRSAGAQMGTQVRRGCNGEVRRGRNGDSDQEGL